MDVARTLTVDPENRVPHLAFQPDALTDLPILSMDEVEERVELVRRSPTGSARRNMWFRLGLLIGTTGVVICLLVLSWNRRR